MHKSFQRRIFIGFTSLVVLVSVLFAGGTILIAYVTEDLLISRLLTLEAEEITQAWQQTGNLPPPSSPYLTLYPNQQAMPQWLNTAWQHSGPDNEVFAEDEHYHIKGIFLSEANKPVLVARVSRLLVVTKMAPGLAIILSIIALLAITLAIFVAWRLAKVINAPLKTLANDVESNRLLLHSQKDSPAEITLLRTKITDTIQALQQALLREQDFTRDVSHELRTPLTHLKNELLLLSQNEPGAPLRQSLEGMQQDVEATEQTLSILLAIAREENLNSEPIKLRSAIETALLKLHQQSDLETLDLHLEISNDVTINTSPVILALILQNILLNAIYHGDGQLHISIQHKILIFSNPLGPLNQHSKGMGHGLKLIEKLANLTGSELSWQNQKQRFSVSLKLEQYW